MEKAALLTLLETRFEQHIDRHEGVVWADVQARLEMNSDKLRSLQEMERTGGEPDVVGYDRENDLYIFMDCSAESPAGRRGVCYDLAGLESRKKHKPEQNAVDLATAMGVEILTEEQYRGLQRLGEFDRKTSSWVATPAGIRTLGGALFGDRRYDTVFIYHNGAQSYYASRGFRAALKL